MVHLHRSPTTDEAPDCRTGAGQSVVLVASVVLILLGTGLGFIRDHLVQIRELEPALAITFSADPLVNVSLFVLVQTALVASVAAVLGRRLHRTAFLFLAVALTGLSFTSLGWIHLLGGQGEKYVPAESLTTAREAHRAIPLVPAAGTTGFALRPAEPSLYAPSTPVWSAPRGPARFVSEPLPHDTLPVLRIVFHSTSPQPDGFFRLESARGERVELEIARFAMDRWQFGHVFVPPGDNVRLVVELPEGSSGMAFQNPVPLGRAAWLSHTAVKASHWLITSGLLLLAVAIVAEWRHRRSAATWIATQFFRIERARRFATARLASASRLGSSRTFALLAVGGIFVTLAWRQHQYVDDYAVNILSWDQWDFYRPLFDGRGWWATFTQQHGPHRQGIGFVVTRLFAELTGWNSRVDALLVSGFIVAAGGLGLLLARRFSHGLTLAWLAVPLLIFNVRQDPAIIGAANLSHGSMPVFLITALGLSWFVRRPWLRYTLICTLTFFLVFTGFGLFMGLLTPLLFAIEGVHAFRSGHRRGLLLPVLGLAAVAATWILFRHGYRFDPAVGDFRFPYEKPWEYAEFCGILVSFFLGVPGTSGWAISIGLAGFCALAAVCGIAGWRVLRAGPVADPRSAVICCFAAFTLIFCANTAVGRVMIGLQGALAHRYVTLLIPGGVAVFLHLLSLRESRLRRGALLGYVAILAIGTTWLRESEWAFSRAERDGRVEWKKVYLETRSEALADERSGFRIYPGSVKERLEFLEQHQLNLFNPNAKP